MKRPIIITLMFVYCCNAALQAQPTLETGSGKMPNEWIDRSTGHKIVKLTRRTGNNVSFYFHNNPFAGNTMVFYGTDIQNTAKNDSVKQETYNTTAGNKQLYSVNLKTLQVEQLTHQSSPMNGEIVAQAAKLVYYQVKDSVFATHLDSKVTKLVYVFPADFKASITTLNSNETLLAGAWSSDKEKELFKNNPNKSSYFNIIYEAKEPRTLFTVDVRTGKLTKLFTDSAWLNHVQFSPKDPNLLMFCHEGPWHKVDRIWTIDISTRKVKLMHKRTMDMEIAGHESISSDGKKIWFDLQQPRGQTFYFAAADIQTGKEIKYAMKRDEWSIHFTAAADQKTFAGDGGDPGQVAKAPNGEWIYVFKPAGDSLHSEKLVNMMHHNYKLEPNVHFSPDHKWIIFRANFEGYTDVYAVEIAKSPVSNVLVPKPAWISSVGARQFPSVKKVFTVNAVSDTSTVITKKIQAAIDDCAKNGGGVVKFAPGVYVTGSIFLKSGVHLQIDKGVLILGSQNFDDYPDIDTRIAGIEMRWPAALINLIDVKNAAVTGDGIINARGKFCWDKYWAMRKEYDTKNLRWIVDYDAKRVRTLLVQNSSDITLKGLTFKNAGFWTVQLLYSHHLTVEGLVIRNNEDGSGPSTDGIDVDSSAWVLIENCDIDCNDDNFCLKAGRDWDGLRVNRPTEYVVIRKCIARRGAGLITLGSETSGGIRHIYATDLIAKHTDNGLRIKSAVTRGGKVEDVYFVNSTVDSVRNAYQFNLNWYPAFSYSTLPKGYNIDSVPAHWKTMLQKVTPAEKGIPAATDFYIVNVTMSNAQKAFEINGLPQSNFNNFNFTNSYVSAGDLGTMEYTDGWKFNNMLIQISKKQEERRQAGGIEQQERLK